MERRKREDKGDLLSCNRLTTLIRSVPSNAVPILRLGRRRGFKVDEVDLNGWKD